MHTYACQKGLGDVIMDTRVVNVTLTAAVCYNRLWLYECELQPYTEKCLLSLFIAPHLKVLQLLWLWRSGMTMPGV